MLLLALELLVRVFHLHNERPARYLDEHQVEKWVPNQAEFSVTGNRKQNVGEYRINNFGFNSIYDNYNIDPTKNNIALVGDSFIEGFHTNYTKSLGQQIEKKNANVKVLEFGYSGYDFADQMHLIKSYNHIFKELDHVIVYLRFTDDLERDAYKKSNRLSLNTPVNKLLKKSKLIMYAKDIGLIDPIKNKTTSILSVIKGKREEALNNKKLNNDSLYLANFMSLTKEYQFNREKYTLLLDKSLCSKNFLDYLNTNNYKTIDINLAFNKANKPVTLIYDQHWSNYGRDLAAKSIANYLERSINNFN